MEAHSSVPEPAIDGHWRADSHGARLVLARNGSGFEELKLIDYSALAIYGPFSSPYLRTMASKVLHWVAKQPESVMAATYDGAGILEGSNSGEDLNSFLRELVDYGNSIFGMLTAQGLVWSPNGKYLVAPLVLSAEDLADPGIWRQLEQILDLSSRTTLRPVLILEDPTALPGAIRELLSWQAFMGRDQIRFSRDRYPVELKRGMATRVPMAIAIDSVASAGRVLNSLSYEPTASAKERKQAIADERENYERFLEGLTDGK